MALSIGSGSAWKNVTNLRVGVSSAWKQAQSVWVGVGGLWKKAWDYLNADAIAVFASDFDGLAGPVNATGVYDSNGTVRKIEGGATTSLGTWLLVGNNSDFEIYLSGTGNTPSGSALNTWLPLSTTRSWYLDLPGSGSESFSGTIQIRRASDQVVVDTASFGLNIESTL